MGEATEKFERNRGKYERVARSEFAIKHLVSCVFLLSELLRAPPVQLVEGHVLVWHIEREDHEACLVLANKTDMGRRIEDLELESLSSLLVLQGENDNLNIQVFHGMTFLGCSLLWLHGMDKYDGLNPGSIPGIFKVLGMAVGKPCSLIKLPSVSNC